MLKAFTALGIPRKRAEAIAALAQATVHNPHLFDPKASLEVAIEELHGLPGIGEWTAQYIAMRVLRESDAFLAGDVALQRALAVDGSRPSSRQLLCRADAWRPWRAYATVHLWTSESLPAQTRNGEASHAIHT